MRSLKPNYGDIEDELPNITNDGRRRTVQSRIYHGSRPEKSGRPQHVLEITLKTSRVIKI